MELYTPGMGSAAPVGQLPVEKAAYDTKNRMMQMDMMGMRSRAAADAAYANKKTQEEKDLLAYDPAKAGYLSDVLQEKHGTPALQNLLSLKQAGGLNQTTRLAVMGPLKQREIEYNSIVDETDKLIKSLSVGYDKVYNQQQIEALVHNEQIEKLKNNQAYTTADIPASIEKARTKLKSLNTEAINNQFIKDANLRKKTIKVSNDPSGLRRRTNEAVVQSYWDADPATGKVGQFDFNGLVDDYTKPGTATQQLYTANKEEKLSDPTFQTFYQNTIAQLQADPKLASDPIKYQAALKKFDAEQFIFPFFGKGARWEDFFDRSQTKEDIRQYVAPTQDQIAKREAQKVGTPEVLRIWGINGYTGQQTTVPMIMTPEQANGLKIDSRYGYVDGDDGVFRTAASQNVTGIHSGSGNTYAVVARTSMPNGIQVYDQNNKRIPVPDNIKTKYSKAYFKNNNAVFGNMYINEKDLKNIMNDLNSQGFRMGVKSSSGSVVNVAKPSDLINVQGAFNHDPFITTTIPIGQEKEQAQGKETKTYTGGGSVNTGQAGVTNILQVGPGLSKQIYFGANNTSQLRNIAVGNLGAKEYQKLLNDVRLKQEQAIIQSFSEPAEQQPNQSFE